MPLAASRAGLEGAAFAVDYKVVNDRPDGICDKPFQAPCDVGEAAVFIEVKITGVSES